MSEVSITERQWERLMEVLWSIDNGIAELNKNLTAETVTEAPRATMEPRFTSAQQAMFNDFIADSFSKAVSDEIRPGGMLYG